MRVGASTFKCKLDFVLNGKNYQICRTGVLQRSGNVKVSVKFYEIGLDGEVIDLSGKRRDETNKIIRGYLGEYDDFILTTFRTQNDDRSFINMTMKYRQELLYRFMGIFIFSKLYNIAHEIVLEYKGILKQYDIISLTDNREQLSKELYEYNSKYEALLKEESDLKSKYKEIQSEIEFKRSKLVDIPTFKAPDEIEAELISLQADKEGLCDEYNQLQKKLREYQENYDSIQVTLDWNNIVMQLDNINKKLDELKSIEKEKAKIESLLTQCNELKTAFAEYEYDPNCKYCVSNEFVVRATEAISKIPLLEDNILRYDKIISEYSSYMDYRKELLQQQECYHKQQEEKLNIKREIIRLENKCKVISNDIVYIDEKIDMYKSELDNAKKYERELLINNKLEDEIRDYTEQLNDIMNNIDSIKTSLNSLLINIEVVKTKIDSVELDIEKYNENQKKYEIYQQYEEIVGRNGVPVNILKNIIHVIEVDINNSLADLVDFTLKIEIVNDNIIGYIIDETGDKRQIELASGMERFILDILIRTSLIKLSLGTMTSFVMIDEGFGALDANSISSLTVLFNYLREQFDFAICISHLETMRDKVDYIINIDKVDGVSKIIMGG